MGQVKLQHWWNGSWARMARRDVLLHRDGDEWLVETRAGGAEGRVRWYAFPDEHLAEEAVSALTAQGTGWREMPIA